MGYTKRNNDGGQSSPKIAERDAKAAATRRAKAAARKSRAKSGNGGISNTLFDGVYADRRAAVEERRLANDVEAYNFRNAQAAKALESPAITTLKEGSIAHKFALLIIEEFPNAEAYV